MVTEQKEKGQVNKPKTLHTRYYKLYFICIIKAALQCKSDCGVLNRSAI